MRLRPRSDFWQVGVVPARAPELLDPAGWTHLAGDIAWLPDPGPWRYLADPFAVRRHDTLHVYVEAFDYRTKHAVIEHYALGPDRQWFGGEIVLSRPYHLSYPFLVEQDGEVFMIPESHKAGEIALYRARAFPDDWVRETVLLGDIPGAEASVIFHEDRWWMFFTLVGPGARDQRELHVAYAPHLTGPWTVHAQNPVLSDRSGARPGGTPFIGADGRVVLPVQNCSRTYGGSLRFIRFEELTPARIVCQHLEAELSGALARSDYPDGMHTFSACGDVTLVDVKRISRSLSRHVIDWRRRLSAVGSGKPKG